jgi:putative photosynthetic complex assembly protein
MQAARQELRDVIPRRAPGFVAVGLVLLLAAVAFVRVSSPDRHEPDASPVAQRALRFLDRTDGGIAIVDAATGDTLDTVHGEQGFLRGTLRGLVRERKRRGDSADAPLELIARADGRLTLADPLTGRRIDLESFGPTNAAVFARWLAPAAATTPEMTR